jgi:hypothetical protein
MIRSRHGVVVALIAGASLAGCATHSALLPGQGAGYNDIVALTSRGVSDVATLPSCKGQKTSKDYSQSKPQGISVKGGSACVPKFKKWGGSVKYPGFSASGGVTMTVISSTTAYDAEFPPSTSAIFYLQLEFNENVKFNSTLPAGVSLAGPGLKVNQTYSIEGARAMGSLWDVLPGCYTKASKGKYGAMIGGLGYPLEGGGFSSSSDAVVMVYSGQVVTTKC